MNQLITIEIISKIKRNEQPTRHTLTVSVHHDILKNQQRLASHCRSLAHKTYGNNVTVERVVDTTNNVLWDSKNG